MFHFTKAQWSNIVPRNIMAYKDGCFLVQYKSKGDMDMVLDEGPYFMNHKPIVVKPWSVGFDVNKEIFRAFQVWVQLHGLPISC